jgi:hypothetical protein
MFSFLTQPNYPKSAIGIEHEGITALSMTRGMRGGWGIRQAATVEMPPYLLKPSFLERNISNRSEFRYLLEEAVTSAGLLNQRQWSVSLPSTTARSAILTLEGVGAKAETEEILDWKSEQSFGAPASELRITRVRISSDQAGRSRYFATAVHLSIIDEYESVFEEIGWRAGLILPRAVSESKWLFGKGLNIDSLLISSQSDGFTAFLIRGDEPAVIRSVTCADSERDDEIYRLLLFYNDRFSEEHSRGFLESLLLVGKGLVPAKIRKISSEALGRAVNILKPDDVGFGMPTGGLSFDSLAAPAALATFGWR